jgi:hypothetical protein
MGVHRTKLVGSGSPPCGSVDSAGAPSHLADSGDLTSKPSNIPSIFESQAARYTSILQPPHANWSSQPPSTQASFQGLEALIQRTTGGGVNGHEDRMPMDLSSSQNDHPANGSDE